MASRLATILENEYKKKGLIGGLASASGKRILETIDPRNTFFGGNTLAGSIGRKLFGKGYSATRGADKASPVSNITQLSQNLNGEVLEQINANSRISAKNSVVLPAMARDMNLTRMNIVKLVKLQGGTPSTKADMFFSRAQERESMYESQFGKRTRSPEQIKTKTEEKRSMLDVFKTVFSGLATIVSGAWQAVTYVIDKITSIIGGLVTSITDLIYHLRLISALEGTRGGLPVPDAPDRGGNKKGRLPSKTPGGFRGRGGALGTLLLGGAALATGADVSAKPEDVEFPGVKPILEHFTGLFNLGSGSKSPTKVNNFASEGETISQSGAMNYLMEKGLTTEQAAGIVGNLMQESRLNSGAYNQSEGAYGIAQWRKERLENYKSFSSMRGKELSDVYNQLDFIIHELNTTERTAASKLAESKTYQEAAFNFGKYYERPKVVEHTRIAYAEQALRSVKPNLVTQENTNKVPGSTINQASFDNQMAKSLSKGEEVVIMNDNKQINNTQQSQASGSVASPWNEDAYQLFAQRSIGF